MMKTGEGGMITTNDPAVAEKARRIRDHGQVERYESELLGYNFRMTELAAALGLAQLGKLESFIERRRANAQYLSEHLQGVRTPAERLGCRQVYHQYTVRVAAGRDELAARLREDGIETGVFYSVPIHRQPLYRGLGYSDSLPVAERLSRAGLSLPVHPGLSRADLEAVVAAGHR